MPGNDATHTALNVVVVGMHYAPERSGNAPYTTGLARGLSRRGMDVTAVAGYPHYPEWRLHPGYEKARAEEWDSGVRLRRQRHPVPSVPTGRARIVMESVFAVRAGRDLLQLSPDVVIAVSPALLSLLPAVLLRSLRRYRLGILVQDLYGAGIAETGLGSRKVGRVVWLLERWLLQKADSVAVIHEVFGQRLIAAGLAPDRVHVIPNWAHIDMPDSVDKASARRELGWHTAEFVALHAGNMGVKQGLEGLVDAARLAESAGSNIRIVLLGDGSRRRALEEYAAGAQRLTFMDALPAGRFEQALMAADCLLLHEKPGVVEMSVPSKLTSYFTAGRPVVAATDPRSGAAALMTAAGAGLLARAGDAASILDGIERLAEDAEAAAAMGASGQRYALEHLRGKTAIDRYETWVRDLAAGRRHGWRERRRIRWMRRPDGARASANRNEL